MVIDKELLDDLSTQAKASPQLRTVRFSSIIVANIMQTICNLVLLLVIFVKSNKNLHNAGRKSILKEG